MMTRRSVGIWSGALYAHDVSAIKKMKMKERTFIVGGTPFRKARTAPKLEQDEKIRRAIEGNRPT
jgi:hypothetical protein